MFVIKPGTTFSHDFWSHGSTIAVLENPCLVTVILTENSVSNANYRPMNIRLSQVGLLSSSIESIEARLIDLIEHNALSLVFIFYGGSTRGNGHIGGDFVDSTGSLWVVFQSVLTILRYIYCDTQKDSTTRYCCMTLFRPIWWPTRSTAYSETTNKIKTQLSNVISNINITWNLMNDRTRNDLQQRVNEVIAEYYP